MIRYMIKSRIVVSVVSGSLLILIFLFTYPGTKYEFFYGPASLVTREQSNLSGRLTA